MTNIAGTPSNEHLFIPAPAKMPGYVRRATAGPGATKTGVLEMSDQVVLATLNTPDGRSGGDGSPREGGIVADGFRHARKVLHQ